MSKTRCTICLDLRVPEINRSLLMTSAQKTAKKFGFTTAATLGRHRRECLKLVASEIKQQRTELRTKVADMSVPRQGLVTSLIGAADVKRHRTPLGGPKEVVEEIIGLYDEFKTLGIDARDLGDLKFFAYVGGERLKVLTLLAKIHRLVDDGIRVTQSVSIDAKLDKLSVDELRALAARERQTVTIEQEVE